MNSQATALNRDAVLNVAYPRSELLEPRRLLAVNPGNVLARGDFNGDDEIDVVVSTRQGARIMASNGDGGFVLYQRLSVGPASAAVAGDFDEDGDDDLAIVLKRNGDDNSGEEDRSQRKARQRGGNRLLGSTNGDGGGEICVTPDDDDNGGNQGGDDDDNPPKPPKPDKPKPVKPKPDTGPAPFPDDSIDGDNDGGDGPGPRDGDDEDEFADPEQDDNPEGQGHNSQRVVVLLNDRGTMRIGQTQNLPRNFSANFIRADDTNGDDNLDLIITKGRGKASRPALVLSGNGNGTFDAPHLS